MQQFLNIMYRSMFSPGGWGQGGGVWQDYPRELEFF